MDPSTENLLFALLGFVVGAASALAWWLSEHQLRGSSGTPPSDAAVVPPDVANVLSVLRSSSVVVDESDQVLQASAPAYSFGLVGERRLRNDEVTLLVQQVRRDGEIRQADIVIDRRTGPPVYLHVRVAPLTGRLTLVLVDDRTREQRVDAIRRDFVANVSHELKTPVGAMTLLAEAVEEAADDPEAVTRFAARMRTEASRLTYLVQQIIELSRLQGDDAVVDPVAVDVDEVVERAVDVSAIEAAAKGIEVVYDGPRGHRIRGNAGQVALALSNLVANAVTYSPASSRVVISAQPNQTMLDLSVSDQGIGIPATDLDRIFERFYRVDPARHRSTGGTGLGLSIVKHVAASHGGDVVVWSAVGEGSSFTLRLPRLLSASGSARSVAESPAPTPVPAPVPAPASAPGPASGEQVAS